MPDEPTPPHPLEAALRAQAARRRADLDAGRPPGLPGPVRAALLREVERGAAPVKGARGHPAAPWWWRWQTLLVTTACVLLAVGIFRRETDSPPPTAEKAPLPAASAPPSAADQRESVAPTEATRERAAAPPPEPAAPRDEDLATALPPAPVLPPAGAAAGGALAGQPAPPADEQPAPGSPAVRLEQTSPPGRPIAAAPAASTNALPGAAAKPAAVASQRFLQTPLQQTLRSARAVGSSPVLTDFTLRREGDTLVIREGDGSEYRAPLGAAKRESSGADALKKDAAKRGIAANERPAAAGQPVAFRATGVNQTLKQAVVIEGVLVPATTEESRAAAPAARPRAAAAPAPAKSKEALARAAPQSRASIRGRAFISDQEYAVEAEEAGAPPAAQ